MNLCLAIDTSGRGGVVCIAHAGPDGDAQLLASRLHRGTNAEALFALFDEVLSESGVDRADLTRVAVIRGPGSFTGLRVGIMVAKALAYGLDIELWAAPTLGLLLAEAGISVAVVGAGRGFVFCESGEKAPRRFSVEELAALGTERIALPTRDPVAAELLREVGGQAEAVELAPALAIRAATGRAPVRRFDAAALTPLYLAPSQAERVHGVDLSEEVHTPAPPESWREWSK